MTGQRTRMLALGYGRFVRADQIVALIPIEGGSRGEGQRTYVHVEGFAEPLVASRSHAAILADMERILGPAPGPGARRRRLFGRSEEGEPTIAGRAPA